MKRSYDYIKENSEFSYKISNFDTVTTSDYFEAVDKSLEDIFQEMDHLNLHKIAICLSGIDSEIIAQRLLKYKKHVEYFFLHVQDINDEHKVLMEKIAENHKVKINIITTTLDFIKNSFSQEVFEFCQMTMATYISIPYLIKNIPNDFYIIIGEGDLEKSNIDKYRTIFNNRISDPKKDEIYVPLHLSEIIYSLSLKKYNKHGESNFYSRKFDTWYHILKDNRLITNYRFFYDPKSDLIHELCGKNFVSPLKTLNYIPIKHRDIIRGFHHTLSMQASRNWNFSIGDIVTIPKDLVF
jgi:hypothetical protein